MERCQTADQNTDPGSETAGPVVLLMSGSICQPQNNGLRLEHENLVASLFYSVIVLAAGISRLSADEVGMQNGDRYFGQVLSVSSDTVVMNSEMLGKIKVPRRLVITLVMGANPASTVSSSRADVITGTKNLPTVAPVDSSLAGVKTNVDLAAAFQKLGANGTNFVGQIRDQMLAGSPEAAGKYDEMANGLMNGSLNLNDVRQQARASADQLRALKQQLGPDADQSLDAYLEVLDNFLKETDAGSDR
jgi:hypothetical protein